MTPIRWDPDRETLSGFSEAWMFFLGMVAAPMALWRGHPSLAVGLWVAAVAGRVVGLVAPTLLRPVFVGMTVLTWPIGWVMSSLVLAIVYYGTVAPIGLLRRAMGRHPLDLEPNASQESYWRTARRSTRPDRDFRQF